MILVKNVRVHGFRGLENIEVDLERITVLTGMNNAGKTSFLRALQIAFGSTMFITADDFYLSGNERNTQIIVDVRIISYDTVSERQLEYFDEDYETLFTTERIRQDDVGNNVMQFRTVVIYNPLTGSYQTEQYVLDTWHKFINEEGKYWYMEARGRQLNFKLSELPFFYIDAQRDIIEDLKLKTSNVGKIFNQIKYDPETVSNIENQISELNDSVMNGSVVLSQLRSSLEQLNSTLDYNGGVEITPFTKNIHDFNKNISIYYSNGDDSHTIDYHGMGTRSWSSLLAFKTFIQLLKGKAIEENKIFFPIIAIEEPEAHLHPNAQKKLYGQIAEIIGQNIISTHSPYIAAGAKLNELRNFIRISREFSCGKIIDHDLSTEDKRKISREVVQTRGELLFSKMIVFCEGETEEQALPIFFESFFGVDVNDLGINIINVNGHKSYKPFLLFASYFHIKWCIFSDADSDEIIQSVKTQIKQITESELFDNYVVFLSQNKNFEKYLIEYKEELGGEGDHLTYIDEIKSSLKDLKSADCIEEFIVKNNKKVKKTLKTGEKCPECDNSLTEEILFEYDGDEGYKRALYDIIGKLKTKFGPVIAEKIVESGKPLPTKIIEVCELVKKNLIKIEL